MPLCRMIAQIFRISYDSFYKTKRRRNDLAAISNTGGQNNHVRDKNVAHVFKEKLTIAKPYNHNKRPCQLCTVEKFEILFSKDLLLNKNSELNTYQNVG